MFKAALALFSFSLFVLVAHGEFDIECKTIKTEGSNEFELVTADNGGKASISGNIIEQSGQTGNITRYNLNVAVAGASHLFNLDSIRFGSTPSDTDNKAILEHLKSHVASFDPNQNAQSLKEYLLEIYDLDELNTTYKEEDGINGFWHDKDQLLFSFNTTKRVDSDSLDFNCNISAQLPHASTRKEENEDTGQLEKVLSYEGLATISCEDAKTFQSKSISSKLYCDTPTPKTYTVSDN